jgi:hypothetical protein
VFYFFLPLGSIAHGKLLFSGVGIKKILNTKYAIYAMLALLVISAISILIFLLARPIYTYTQRSAEYYQYGFAKRTMFAAAWTIPGSAVLMIVICASAFPFLSGLGVNTKLMPGIDYSQAAYQILQPYHVANSYGLFRSMTGVGGRPELVIQGSSDGKTWRDYVMPYKPQDPKAYPPFNIPHQPRLDW